MAHVLIVDDERDLANSLAGWAEIDGYKVTVASNGREAVECFRDRDYDVAFMDVRMPVVHGGESFFEIRQLRPNAKVVLMTGLREPIVEKAVNSGVLGLLMKPFRLSEFMVQLKAAIGAAFLTDWRLARVGRGRRDRSKEALGRTAQGFRIFDRILVGVVAGF